MNEEQKHTTEPPLPSNPAELMKDFDFEKFGIDKEEFEKANEVFTGMMKDFN